MTCKDSPFGHGHTAHVMEKGADDKYVFVARIFYVLKYVSPLTMTVFTEIRIRNMLSA